MRNQNPLYNLTNNKEESITLFSKQQLINYNLKDIIKIEWYKGCGEWIEITNKFIKKEI